MVHCGIWEWCTVRFVQQVQYLHFTTKSVQFLWWYAQSYNDSNPISAFKIMGLKHHMQNT